MEDVLAGFIPNVHMNIHATPGVAVEPHVICLSVPQGMDLIRPPCVLVRLLQYTLPRDVNTQRSRTTCKREMFSVISSSAS